MIENKPIGKSRDTVYKVVIILIVAVAAYSSAMKELNRLQEVAGTVHYFTSEGLGGLARVYAATMSVGEDSQFIAGPETSSIDGFHWAAPVATGGSMEVQWLERDTTEPRTKGEAEILADDKAQSSGPNAEAAHLNAEAAHLVEHSRNMTVSAIYPKSGANELATCELAKGKTLNVWDVRLSTLANAADAVGFAEDAINRELGNITLPGSVIANTLKRRIKVEKRNNVRERAVTGEVPVRPGKASWPESFEFKKLTRALRFDFLSPAPGQVELEVFDSGISPDLHLLPAKENVKHAGGESEMSSWR